MTILTRRNFIRLLSVSGLIFPVVMQSCKKDDRKVKFRILSEEEANLLSALVDQIIPEDDFDSGSEAGVVNFIDKQLKGPYKRHVQDYRSGLLAMQTTCKKKHNTRFEQLGSVDQLSFVKMMESGELQGEAWKNISSRSFFNLVRRHSLQGFYGSPRHGGNKDYISYKMIGLDYPHVIGRNKYLQ